MGWEPESATEGQAPCVRVSRPFYVVLLTFATLLTLEPLDKLLFLLMAMLCGVSCYPT